LNWQVEHWGKNVFFSSKIILNYVRLVDGIRLWVISRLVEGDDGHRVGKGFRRDVG